MVRKARTSRVSARFWINFNNTHFDRHDFHSPSHGACEIEFLCMLFAHRWLSYLSLLSQAFAFLPWPFTVNFCSLDLDPRYLRMPSTQADFEGFTFMEVQDELVVPFCRKLWKRLDGQKDHQSRSSGWIATLFLWRRQDLLCIYIIYEHVCIWRL